ncbi:MAG: hypothetical protein K2P17_06240 [Helicobacteraceae bacterium]|nr:hypothetical protein [Helicobacteraceae bacterium]
MENCIVNMMLALIISKFGLVGHLRNTNSLFLGVKAGLKLNVLNHRVEFRAKILLINYK